MLFSLSKTCWRLVDRIKVGQALYIFFGVCVCVAICCQTAQENAALKQYFFYKINQHALVFKQKSIWGVTHMIPHVRDWKLTEQSQVTSLENEKTQIKIDVLGGLVAWSNHFLEMFMPALHVQFFKKIGTWKCNARSTHHLCFRKWSRIAWRCIIQKNTEICFKIQDPK